MIGKGKGKGKAKGGMASGVVSQSNLALAGEQAVLAHLRACKRLRMRALELAAMPPINVEPELPLEIRSSLFAKTFQPSPTFTFRPKPLSLTNNSPSSPSNPRLPTSHVVPKSPSAIADFSAEPSKMSEYTKLSKKSSDAPEHEPMPLPSDSPSSASNRAQTLMTLTPSPISVKSTSQTTTPVSPLSIKPCTSPNSPTAVISVKIPSENSTSVLIPDSPTSVISGKRPSQNSTSVPTPQTTDVIIDGSIEMTAGEGIRQTNDETLIEANISGDQIVESGQLVENVWVIEPEPEAPKVPQNASLMVEQSPDNSFAIGASAVEFASETTDVSFGIIEDSADGGVDSQPVLEKEKSTDVNLVKLNYFGKTLVSLGEIGRPPRSNFGEECLARPPRQQLRTQTLFETRLFETRPMRKPTLKNCGSYPNARRASAANLIPQTLVR